MSKLEEGFLLYDSQWIEITQQQANDQNVYKSKSIFNPIPAHELDPKDIQLLNKMFEPYVIEKDGKYFRLNISRRQTSRQQLQDLEKRFEIRLKQKQARRGGICPIRQQLHNQLFDQIIRQATVNLPERGILLMRVRDNLKMTFAAYQTLYEGSLIFGNRKSHVAQVGLPELQSKIQRLRKKKIEMENKKIMLENELQAVQQGFREVQAIEQKARNQQLTYIKSQTKRLEDYLGVLYGD